MANNKTKPLAKYQYQDILLAFKLASTIIKNKKFEDINHKFNYIMIIVESKINDIVLAKRKQIKNKAKIENIDFGNQFNEGAKYQSKSTLTTNEILDELW